MKELYRLRFSDKENRRRDKLWKVLCQAFLQHYVPLNARVLDVGCGDCLFLRHIRCGEKFGIDCRGGSLASAPPGTKISIGDGVTLDCYEDGFFDVVCASNFFEHLATRRDILVSLGNIARVLKNGGRLLILQPNIRAVGARYWDYFDHQLALTDRSMVEALGLSGFRILEVRPRFLPFTTKMAVAGASALRLYLKLRILHPLLGRQMFIFAVKDGAER